MSADSSGPVRQWRVPVTLPVTKLAGAVALVALGLLFADGDPVRPGLAAVVATGLLGWALRDLLAPVRLAVDPDGVAVGHGYLGRRRIPWSAIEAISVDNRPRLGLRNELLEIDAGESLHLFGRYDLGAEPAEVAEMLRAVQATRAGVTPGSAEQGGGA